MTDSQVSMICAVVVSYHPDATALHRVCAAIASQVGAVVLVDNGSDGDWQHALGEMLEAGGGALLAQSRNVGLAAAQNAGIQWARQHGFDYVLLLDQDSEPGDGMAAALLSALESLSMHVRVAAVGPRFHDRREDRDAPFVRIGFPFNHKRWCRSDKDVVACDFLISSGSLIPLPVMEDVGCMDEGLFIDNVDLEWSFRARDKGYALYGVGAAWMQHRLGDARRPLPLGLGQVVVHGPARLYFMMRNRLCLYRMAHVPRIWVAQDVPRVLVKLFLFGLVVGPRRRNWQAMLRGLRDGIHGKLGAYPY